MCVCVCVIVCVCVRACVSCFVLVVVFERKERAGRRGRGETREEERAEIDLHTRCGSRSTDYRGHLVIRKRVRANTAPLYVL